MSLIAIPKFNRGWNVPGECFHTHYKNQVSLLSTKENEIFFSGFQEKPEK
jgi:hypothetical protein